MDKKQTEEETKLVKKAYYIKRQEYFKKYQLAYYHRTKVLAVKKNRIPYYLKFFNRRLVKTSTRVHILRDYNKHKYYRYILEEGVLGRNINEARLLTTEDKKYINKLNYDKVRN